MIKFCRLVQNDMSTAVIWSKSKPIWRTRIPWHVIPEQPATLQGAGTGRIQRHVIPEPVSHCRVLPLCEFTVMIPEPHATSQGTVTWRNQCHDRATLQGVIIPSTILKIVYRHILFIFWFLMQFGL